MEGYLDGDHGTNARRFHVLRQPVSTFALRLFRSSCKCHRLPLPRSCVVAQASSTVCILPSIASCSRPLLESSLLV